MDDYAQSFKDLAKEGFTVSLMHFEEGYRELTELLQAKLDSLDNDARVHYLQEVYNGYFIYAVRNSERGDTTLYRRDYSVNNGEITLGESPVEVRKKVEYVTAQMHRTRPPVNDNNNLKDKKMKDSVCCEAKVDALIANADTRFTAADKEWLLTLNEQQIEKLSPVERKETPPALSPKVNKEQVVDEFKSSLKTFEDFTAIMPEEMRNSVNEGIKLYEKHRTDLIKFILDNTKETWEEDELKAMNTNALEKVSKSINKTVDYSAQGAGFETPKSKSGGPLIPASVRAYHANKEGGK